MSRKFNFNLSLLSICLLIMVFLPVVSANEPNRTYLVVLPKTSAQNTKQVSANGGFVIKTLGSIDTLIVRMSPTAATKLASLNKDWIIEEEKYFTSTDTQGNPPSWGLDRTDQRDLPLDSKYNYAATEQGQGVTAYVFDTGIRRDHFEFAGRLLPGFQGYTDTSGVGDCQGHGTHVAGTIGGTTVGIAKKVSLVPIVVLDCKGSGSSAVIAMGADWVVADHQNGTPAVANMSLGSGISNAIDAVVTKMIADGISVVVAAGNSGLDACNFSPARVSSAITVGATSINDTRTSWSNFGTCLDLFSPGENIYSAYSSSSGSYISMSGTSMASPSVSGIVARYLGTNPTATPLQTWETIRSTLTPSKVINSGVGSPNYLLYADPTGYQPANLNVPSKVDGVLVSSVTSSSATISWNEPSSGGSPITSYFVEVSTSSDFSSEIIQTRTISRSTNLSALTASKNYFVRVAAVSAIGQGLWSSTSSFTTLVTSISTPSAPSNFKLTKVTMNSASFSWLAPVSSINHYTLQVSTSSSFTNPRILVLSPSSLTSTVSSLKSRTTYFARISASNENGTGSWSQTLTFTLLK